MVVGAERGLLAHSSLAAAGAVSQHYHAPATLPIPHLPTRCPPPGASDATVLMVVGAGRGPLVRASLAAADAAGRPLRVYAVEKNANAVITLQNLVQSEGCAAPRERSLLSCRQTKKRS